MKPNKMRAKILLVEDDHSFVNTLRLILRDEPIDIIAAKTGGEAIKLFKENRLGYALAIFDYCLPDLKGSEVALTIRKITPSQECLFTSGFDDPVNLIDVLESGAGKSFLFKGRPIEELRRRILDSIDDYRLNRRLISQTAEEESSTEIKFRKLRMIGGRAPSMARLMDTLERCRIETYPTLIVGETGTGKELIAQALVPSGKRLISIDCPRYSKSENLLENDLFGYVKGAYTGADKDTSGLLSQAQDQVLFLDELHRLPIEAQAKLLRFLQEMKYRRVGDHSGREISIRFKLIAAAKPEIFDLVREGLFLEDLLHRVGKLEIHVPSLNDRLEDLETLVRSIEADFNRGKPEDKQKLLRTSTISEMSRFKWTGNIRQLQNAVVRMMTFAREDIVNPADFQEYLQSRGDVTNAVAISLSEAANGVEVEHIARALTQSKTKHEAATRLGISRWTLGRTMDRLGISADSYLARP